MKPTKCPEKETKLRQAKRQKRRGEKEKRKSQDKCVTFKPKNYTVYLEMMKISIASGSEGREVNDL